MTKNILLITAIMLLTLCSQILLKKGLRIIGQFDNFSFPQIYLFISKLAQNRFIWLGVIIAALAAFLWLIVISRIDLTKAFPISGGIFYLLLFLFSWLYLGEAVTFLKILGIVIIILGIYLIALS